MRLRAGLAGLLLALGAPLLALSPAIGQPAAPTSSPTAAPTRPWVFEKSDIVPDQGFRFGRLANGMRYVVRPNVTPRGTVMVRMQVEAGSLDETEAERGYAHFVEHMAFQGSSHVPEGEMVRLLERAGLAFGADTNAFTGFENTTYALDLPRNDTELVDTALMLMRETVSELRFSPQAVARERGVVLAEKRDRNGWQFRDMQDRLRFFAPRARYPERLPIGTETALNAASAETLRAFWHRLYVPGNVTLVVIGDIEPAAVEAAIHARFDTWAPAPIPARPDPGPIDPADHNRDGLFLDPAESQSITVVRNGAWLNEPDTLAQRREDLLRRLGYGIVGRRFQHVARRPDTPYRVASLGTSDLFKRGRSTSLAIDALDGKPFEALAAAATEYRRALERGFTTAEVAEQIANLRNSAEHAAAAADTRDNAELTRAVLTLLREDQIPTDPRDMLALIDHAIPGITPEAVLAALKRELVPLDSPLIRLTGRHEPAGGTTALRATWDRAMSQPLSPEPEVTAQTFAYTSFGAPGRVVSDRREPNLGIRELRFANGLRLNLIHTNLVRDQVLVRMALDGGHMLATRDNPLAVEMVPMFTAGGLGQHSQDQLQTILAGHTLGAGLSTQADTFVASAQTTPADLDLQLRLMTAYLTDPGYRPEGEAQYRMAMINFFNQYRANPGSALNNAMGGILSDNEPRFTLQPQSAYRALSFSGLKQALADRLAHGAIELAIVGDVDEDKAIKAVAASLGALPARETEFGAWSGQRQRPFTADHRPRQVRHTGPADQAMIRMTWLTRDDYDPVAKQVLNMLARVAQIELTELLRQKLGKAYSPSAASDPTRAWPGYGTFTLTASVDVKDLPVARAAMREVIAGLRERPVDADVLQRARAPLAESFDNLLKTNGGWMALVARAQTEPDRIERQLKARARLEAVTAEDVRTASARYLTEAGAVEVSVLPEDVSDPAGPAQPAPTAPAPR